MFSLAIDPSRDLGHLSPEHGFIRFAMIASIEQRDGTGK
jgi:hypothetical protein